MKRKALVLFGLIGVPFVLGPSCLGVDVSHADQRGTRKPGQSQTDQGRGR